MALERAFVVVAIVLAVNIDRIVSVIGKKRRLFACVRSTARLKTGGVCVSYGRNAKNLRLSFITNYDKRNAIRSLLFEIFCRLIFLLFANRSSRSVGVCIISPVDAYNENVPHDFTKRKSRLILLVRVAGKKKKIYNFEIKLHFFYLRCW